MQVATALRIVSVVVAAKALLIGVVYWRRAEILGRPIHIGTASWAGLIAVFAVAVAPYIPPLAYRAQEATALRAKFTCPELIGL